MISLMIIATVGAIDMVVTNCHFQKISYNGGQIIHLHLCCIVRLYIMVEYKFGMVGATVAHRETARRMEFTIVFDCCRAGKLKCTY